MVEYFESRLYFLVADSSKKFSLADSSREHLYKDHLPKMVMFSMIGEKMLKICELMTVLPTVRNQRLLKSGSMPYDRKRESKGIF